MDIAEIEKEIDKLAKLGLLEKRVVNGRSEVKITQLGKRYVEINILPNVGGKDDGR